ncbi:MAG: transposase, partial [Coriobacteriia bacterium]|nr:transposase [Coriobacteriia bacterium]
MFLRKSRRPDGRVYVSIVRSYKDGKVTRAKTYESIGYFDPSDPSFDDDMARLEKRAVELEAKWQEEHGSVTLEFSRDKKIDMRTDNRKNVGYFVLADKYYSLELDRFWQARAKSRGFKYNPNAIFSILIWQRLLDPGSKIHDHGSKGRYFDRSDFTERDLYRALDFFAEHKDGVIARINTVLARLRDRKTEDVYYDTTNYYFEIDKSDDDKIDELTGEVIKPGLRKEGPSKENKRSPIISMGLLMDSEGLPLHFELFPGNTADCLTAIPVLKRVKENYDSIGRVVMVADRAINTSDNIAACVLQGNGYVLSQSIKKSDWELRDWVLSDTGYHTTENFKHKSRQGYK